MNFLIIPARLSSLSLSLYAPRLFTIDTIREKLVRFFFFLFPLPSSLRVRFFNGKEEKERNNNLCAIICSWN